MEHYETLKNGTVAATDSFSPINSAGPILASFVNVKDKMRLLDLGTGNGIIPLWLADRGKKPDITAIDIQKNALDLLKISIKRNALENISVLEADLKTFTSPKKFDVVCCNPPFFDSSSAIPSDIPSRSISRFSLYASVFDVTAAAARNLKDGGSFCCCFEPCGMQRLFKAMEQACFSPRRLLFCRHRDDLEPWLVLIDARFRRGEELHILPDLITESGGEKTKEYREILWHGVSL